MLLEEAIQRVQSLYSKGVQSKDTRLVDRHVYSALISSRSRVLRQQSNSSQYINEHNYQLLPCVELIPATKHECECAPPGCIILRTKEKIPSTISDSSGHLIRVTTADGGISFDFTTFDTVRYTVGNKYTSKKPRFYIRNEYIYIVFIDVLKAISISALFNDPVRAYSFPSLCPCEDCECKDIMQMEFPMDENIGDSVFALAEKELIMILKQIGEDKNSNATDDESAVGLIHQPKE